MVKSTPGRIGALAIGTAVMASGLVATGGTAFADDDEYDHHSTCTSTPLSNRDHDEYDDEYEDECDDSATPAPTPTPDPTETTPPVANALLSVQRESARRLAVDAGVENGNPGESWRLEVWQNGRKRLSTTVTANSSGTAQVSHALKNRPGTDKIKVVGTGASGQRVTAKVKGFAAAPRPPQNSNKNNGQSGNQNSGSSQNHNGTSKQS